MSGPRRGRARRPAGAFLAAAISAQAGAAAADCADVAGAERVHEAVRRSVVKIEVSGSGAGCSGFGTGFLVSAEGDVMTAGHVVPDGCTGLRITGRLEDGASDIELQPVARSALDVAVLSAKPAPTDRLPLALLRAVAEERAYEGRRAIVASFYPEHARTTFTTARIDSVELQGDPDRWSLCGAAANKGRSGSPVVLDDGVVAAVFVQRPGGDVQDAARIVPIAALADLILPDAGAGPVASVDASSGAAQKPGPVLYEFDLEAATTTHADPRRDEGRHLLTVAGVEPAHDLSALELLARVAAGAKVRYPEAFTREFAAFPGYEFDPSFLELRLASHAPRAAPLPDRACSAAAAQDCYEFSPDRKRLTLRLRLFAGPQLDQTRGWIDAGVVTRLLPAPG